MTSSFTTKLRGSTATAAVIAALGAPAVLAQQAFVNTDLGIGEAISTSADYTGGNTQKLTSTPTATTNINNVNIVLTASDANPDIVTTGASASDNLISASSTGNLSTALATLAFAPTTGGDTAAVGTLQSVEADVISSSTDDTHSIVIENDDTGVRTFTGSALQSNNDITATTSGNDGTSSITVASGLNVEQAGAGQAALNLDGSLSASPDNSASGDLVVSSSQEIDGDDSLDPTLNVTSAVETATTTIFVEDLDDATVNITESDQASSATGNTATNSITSLDTSAEITASTAISNLQTIDPFETVTIGATTSDSTISAVAGDDSTSNGNPTTGGGGVVDSTVSLSDNTQSSAATGSTSTQTLTLDASSITGEGSPAILDGSLTPGIQTADGDAIVGNVQSINPEVTVSAATTSNTIVSDMSPTNEVDVTNSTLELDGNTQSASATGVSTTNDLSLTSGATMSAAGGVASVQSMDGEVRASASGNSIENLVGNEDLTDSSMLTTENSVEVVATGASASNTLSTTTATNNLSVAANTGAVSNSGAATGGLPSVVAGQALSNDQSSDGAITAEATDNQILTAVDGDFVSSTVTTDGNTLSASAMANEAENAINLSFNNLTGAISGSGAGVVAGLANEQTLSDSTTVTARNVGTNGIPILTSAESDVGDDVGSQVSTSNNTVAVSANGNVTTGNDVVVDATNITSGSEAGPNIAGTSGVLTAAGSFVSTSTQVSGANILASQLDDSVTPNFSNTIETQFGDDIQDSSTVVSDNNVLSASGTANRANNAVELGDADTATVAASGVVANYQGTSAQGSVSAEIGTLGSDNSDAYSSLNSGTSATGTLEVSGNDIINNSATPLTLTFNNPLTSEEVTILQNAGYTNAAVGGTTADLPGNSSADFSIFNANFAAGGGGVNTGDESFDITGFSTTAVPGVANGAGVIVRLDSTGGAEILDSTVSVSGNTVVGEVNGNVATNEASATATTVSGLGAAATSIDTSDLVVAPSNSDLATANLQENASALTSDVAATFAILAGELDDEVETIEDSTQTVSDNLQQSYATANRTTNSVDLTATNTDADTALDSLQRSSATVGTTSDMDVVANAGGTNSSLEMDGNQNQSVANGNVATNTTTLDVTNANETSGTDASINIGTSVGTANNALSSDQQVTADISALARTDVFNQDATRTGGNEIIDSSVSLSGNGTIAQATGNNGSQTVALGDAGTANMDRTGVLMNNQSVTADAVSSTVDQDVSVALANSSTVPVQASSLSLEGNSTTALARSNVSTNTLNVDGANVTAGAGTDAAFSETAGTLNGAYVLGSFQDNTADVTATTGQARVEIDMSNTGGNAIDNSSLSLSENASSATALANTAINSVSIGANAANADGAAALGNVQANVGGVTATGGSAVGVYTDATGGTDPSGISGSTVLLSENVSASNAVGNQAQNTLTASGANISSGGADSASLDAQTPDDLTASAGNLLLSDQANFGAITSTNTANTVTINSSAADGAGSAAVDSTLSLTGNTTEARATANLVLNSSISIGGASTSSADASGLIGNFQFNEGTGEVTASASTSTTISLNGVAAAGALSNGSAMVQDNTTLALARGNVVENTLTANGSVVGAGASPATVNSNGSPDAADLTASYGVFNEQVQQAPINAISVNATYAVNATSGTGAALNGASAMVGGNSVEASAFGNVATNSVTLTSLNGTGNDASAAVYNGQINAGGITSRVTGAQIGTYSTGGVTSASVGVSGNSISSTAVGNFASSTVTRASR